jgi:hypothetical protein
MANFTATIRWRRNGALFSDNRYARAHTWSFDGGAQVPGSSSPHVVPVPYSDPAGEGRMQRNAEGKMAVTRVTLRPHVAFAGQAPDDEAYRALHAEAHHECFIANSVKTEIVCEPTLAESKTG